VLKLSKSTNLRDVDLCSYANNNECIKLVTQIYILSMLLKRSHKSRTNRAEDIALVSMFENYWKWIIFFRFLSALGARHIFIPTLYVNCRLCRKSSITFGCFNVGLHWPHNNTTSPLFFIRTALTMGFRRYKVGTDNNKYVPSVRVIIPSNKHGNVQKNIGSTWPAPESFIVALLPALRKPSSPDMGLGERFQNSGAYSCPRQSCNMLHCFKAS
jgi:hypothetical protein